jgi:hypothetical protein
MQVYDLSAVDGALLCGGMLLYYRSVKRSEAIFAVLAAASLVAAHWLGPYPVYVAASFICPLSFIAYLLYSRNGWRRLRLAVGRRSRRDSLAPTIIGGVCATRPTTDA